MKRWIAVLLVLIALFSLGAVSASAESLGDRLLKVGMSGDDVKQAHQRLIDYYYLSGTAGTEFTVNIEKAVRNFQSRNSLAVSGMIDSKTASVLLSTKAVYANNPLAPTYVLYVGDSGEAVKQLQRELRKTFYYDGKITGNYDAATITAVKRYQRSVGLKVDGKAGYKTKTSLYNRTAAIFNGGIPQNDLSSGDRGYDVYVLQKKLINLNYLIGEATGVYDSDTIKAMKAFEAANNLLQTGLYTSITRRYLYPTTVDNKEAIENAEKGTIDDPYEDRVLYLGASGSDVANAQMRLKAAGYLLGKADGVFGPITRAAVVALQKDYSLKADGIIGKKTWAILKTFNITNAEPDPVSATEPAATPPTKLYLWSTGSNVMKLQQGLITLGYLPAGEDDGVFGKRTLAAVKNFQYDQKLTVDGIVGTKTIVALNEALGIQWLY